MELILLRSAESEIQKNFNYFEDQQEGLGHRFIIQLERGFDRILQFPEIAPVVHGRYRRLVLSKFPYGIFYVGYPTRITIASVMDLRQDPKIIKRQLDDLENR